MKPIQLTAIFAALLLLAASCSKQESDIPSDNGYGRIQLRGTADVSIATRAEIDVTTLGVTVPRPSDLGLTIHSDNPEVNSVWESSDAFNAADTLFKAGTYTATLTYGDPAAEGVNKPYYSGSEQFDLVAGATANVSVTARIANSMAEIRTTDAFNRYFHNATFTLRTGSGNEFQFTPGAETADSPVFVQAGTSISISGTARQQSQTGTDEGPEVKLAAEPLASTSPRTRHIFTFDAADAGSATLHITLAENEELTTSVDIELNDNAE